jgi:hypothetical protein
MYRQTTPLRSSPRAVLLLVPLLALSATASCGSPDRRDATAHPLRPSAFKTHPAALHPPRFFSADGLWNRTLAARVKLDRHARKLLAPFEAVLATQLYGYGPKTTIDTVAYSVPIYTVQASEPTVAVALNNSPRPALSSAWSEVPLPADAQPAAGTDHELVVWQPSTNRMWEFWRLQHTSNGWSAAWGGAMQNVSRNPGVYGSDAWPGATPWWGATASSLALAGGLITFEDLADGQIDHALAMSIPDVRAHVYASPAQRTDGTSTSSASLPEGAHLRLDPSLDLQSLHLPRLTLMLAEAAQRYGIYVRDTSPNIGFYAQDPTPTGSNPYTGPGGYFEGKSPTELLQSFPWSHLQVLRMELHSATAGRGQRP